jgi:hypothetical protein
MFLLNKVSSTSKRSSREFTAEECAEIDNMDYMYAACPEKPRNRERKQSRIRASFFGAGRRKSLDVPTVDDLDDGLKSPSRTYTEDAEGASIYSRRRRLRKMTSKSSLTSISTSSFSESSHEGRTKSRLFSTETLFRGGSWTPPAQQTQIRTPIHQSCS